MGLYFGRSSLRSSYEDPKGILKPVAWKRFERGIPLHKAEFRYLESAYLEEWADELGLY